MIESKTVFILGAGAHYPYGFPIMSKLKTEIVENFPNQYIHFQRSQWQKNQAKMDAGRFVTNFNLSPIESIDLYLHCNKEFAEMGKAAIFYNLLFKEKDFRTDNYLKYLEKNNIPKDDWFRIIFNQMMDHESGEDGLKNFQSDKISFITFNYDRFLEFMFFRALRFTYGKYSEAEIVEAAKKIKIYHIYGSLGKLNYSPNESANELRFGETDIDYYMTGNNFMNNIKLIHERNPGKDGSDFQEIISNAKRIYFLGFSYADENLKLLNIPNCFNDSSTIYGTGFLYEDPQILKYKRKLSKSIQHSNSVYLIKGDCSYLLRNYL
jgi:hypothetical protein